MFTKCETDQLYLEMKEESRKLINKLQYNLIKENEVYENEKRQLYEFIEKITLDFQDIAEKNKLKIEIPSKFIFLLHLNNYLLLNLIFKINFLKDSS